MNDKEFESIVRYGYRQHKGGLEESLRTKVYIRQEQFNTMLSSGKFHVYGFDSRCNQLLWLSSTTQTWLFVEIYPRMSKVVERW